MIRRFCCSRGVPCRTYPDCFSVELGQQRVESGARHAEKRAMLLLMGSPVMLVTLAVFFGSAGAVERVGIGCGARFALGELSRFQLRLEFRDGPFHQFARTNSLVSCPFEFALRFPDPSAGRDFCISKFPNTGRE